MERSCGPIKEDLMRGAADPRSSPSIWPHEKMPSLSQGHLLVYSVPSGIRPGLSNCHLLMNAFSFARRLGHGLRADADADDYSRLQGPSDAPHHLVVHRLALERLRRG